MPRRKGSQVEKMVVRFMNLEQRHHGSPSRSSRPSCTELQPMLQTASLGGPEMAGMLLESAANSGSSSSSGAGSISAGDDSKGAGNGSHGAAHDSNGASNGNGHDLTANGSIGSTSGNGHVLAANGSIGSTSGNGHDLAANGSVGSTSGTNVAANGSHGARLQRRTTAHDSNGAALTDPGDAGNGGRRNGNGEAGGSRNRRGRRDATDEKLEDRPGTCLCNKLKSVGSKICNCLKREDDPPCDDRQPISAGNKDWAERVDKVLENPMNKRRMAYFVAVTMFLTVLLARPHDSKNASTGEKIEMAIEMVGAFFTVSVCLYNTLSYHSVKTTAPRLSEWNRGCDGLMMWSFTAGFIGIYTSHIPSYLFGWWLWVIMACYIALVSAMSIRLVCLGRARESEIIHRSTDWV